MDTIAVPIIVVRCFDVVIRKLFTFFDLPYYLAKVHYLSLTYLEKSNFYHSLTRIA